MSEAVGPVVAWAARRRQLIFDRRQAAWSWFQTLSHNCSDFCIGAVAERRRHAVAGAPRGLFVV